MSGTWISIERPPCGRAFADAGPGTVDFVREPASQPDYALILAIAGLLAFGPIMVYSSSVVAAAYLAAGTTSAVRRYLNGDKRSIRVHTPDAALRRKEHG